MASSRLEYLFDLYVHFKCTEEEEKELMDLLAESENKAAVHSLIDEIINATGEETKMPNEVAASVLQNILKGKKGVVAPLEKKKINLSLWMRVAAATVVVAIASYWFLDKKDDKKSNVIAAAIKQAPILPGGNRATLTLSDGSTVMLDSLQNGLLQYGNIKITKQDGLLIYDKQASVKSGDLVLYNTLSTPRGGQYQVVLPDGSKVWLNAGSSLHFPTTFTGDEREVTLTGEGYFEVAKNKEKPFRVKVDSMSVNVLGTHFNVNAYKDESAIKTSLLEGSVKVVKGTKVELLKPGNQAALNKKHGTIEIADVDMDGVVAWKNGLFQFEGADVTTVMREIGRWYNVEIVYSGKVPNREFEGKISRNAELAEVLRILELSKIKFSVKGRKIIVN